jgi:hypothetical protein
LTPDFGAFRLEFTDQMDHARNRTARLVSPNGVSDAAVAFIADFYRQEFIRHRECLAAQREYFSEQAITDADRALALVLNQLDQLCTRDNADTIIGKLLRQFNAVTGLSAWSDPSQRH